MGCVPNGVHVRRTDRTLRVHNGHTDAIVASPARSAEARGVSPPTSCVIGWTLAINSLPVSRNSSPFMRLKRRPSRRVRQRWRRQRDGRANNRRGRLRNQPPGFMLGAATAGNGLDRTAETGERPATRLVGAAGSTAGFFRSGLPMPSSRLTHWLNRRRGVGFKRLPTKTPNSAGCEPPDHHNLQREVARFWRPLRILGLPQHRRQVSFQLDS